MRTSVPLTRFLLIALAVAMPLHPSWTSAAQPGAMSPAPSSRQPIFGRSLIVVVPDSRDALLAYSMETGRWHRQAVSATGTAMVHPAVSDHIAAVRVDNQVFAFSALEGDWDSVVVSSDPGVLPMITGDAATILDGHRFYVFSASSGEWSGIDLVTGKSIK